MKNTAKTNCDFYMRQYHEASERWCLAHARRRQAEHDEEQAGKDMRNAMAEYDAAEWIHKQENPTP